MFTLKQLQKWSPIYNFDYTRQNIEVKQIGFLFILLYCLNGVNLAEMQNSYWP